MLFHHRASWKNLAGLCRRLGTSLEAGVDVVNSLDREADKASGRYRRVLESVRDDVAVGANLADSVARADDSFPPLFCQMLGVGEETGHTGQLLLKMAKHYEKLLQLRRLVLTALIKPGIQLFMALGVIAVMIWVPSIVSPQSPIDILGLGLVGNRGLLIYFMFLGGIALGVTGLLMEWWRGRMGVRTVTRLAMRIPAIGNFIRTAAMARMAWALSMTTGAGMDARRSMQASLASTYNPYYTQHEQTIDRSIAAGQKLHEALSSTGAFPIELVEVVEVGEETGRLSESLDHLAVQLEDRANALAGGIAIVGTFAVWGLVSAFIIFMIFRIASFYLGTIQGALDSI